MSSNNTMRIGIGIDAHQFASPSSERVLVLMGTPIAGARGLAGHSDADVMCHALMDALLGAAALGDIGSHFPSSDPAYSDAHSMDLLSKVVTLLNQAGVKIINVDICLIGESPKINTYASAMKQRTAKTLGIDPSAINIKATTTDKMGFTGRNEGLAAQAIALIEIP